MSKEVAFIREELHNSLSELEVEILTILKTNQARSSEIFTVLKKQKRRGIAPTTVTVMLDRLHTKGLTEREIESCRGGYRYIYRLNENPEHYHKKLVEKSVDKLIKKFGSTAIAYFNERFKEK